MTTGGTAALSRIKVLCLRGLRQVTFFSCFCKLPLAAVRGFAPAVTWGPQLAEKPLFSFCDLQGHTRHAAGRWGKVDSEKGVCVCVCVCRGGWSTGQAGRPCCSVFFHWLELCWTPANWKGGGEAQSGWEGGCWVVWSPRTQEEGGKNDL